MDSSTLKDDPWLSAIQVAQTLGESYWLVLRSLQDRKRADALYGEGNWRSTPSPLSRKREYRVRRSAVLRLAAGAANDR